MKAYITSVILAVLLLTSCSYTPEERAEKTVKEFCKAIQENNYNKETSLTYDETLVEAVEEATEGEAEPLESNLQIKVRRNCVINDDNKISITSVRNIYSNLPSTEEEEATQSEEEVPADADDDKDKVYSSPDYNISWPSDVIAAYEVKAQSGSHDILFIVVQLGEKDFKVYSTKGLYTYDFSEVVKLIGREPLLIKDVDDKSMEQNVGRLVDDLKTFDILANAVASKDMAKLMRIFPRLKNHEYKFKWKPAPNSYKQYDGFAVITTVDSLAFKISPDGKIVDSFGLISSREAEDAVKALGGTPYNHIDYFDIEYINALKNQAEALRREKERKAQVAKYKAQGVALVSARFTNNGKGAKGVEFTALNTSSKTAKYVIMEIVGYNSVDDPVWSSGYLKKCRGIGPIGPGEVGRWDFDDIWENGSIVASYEIKTLTIQFTDGSSKSIKLPRTLPSDWRTWLY